MHRNAKVYVVRDTHVPPTPLPEGWKDLPDDISEIAGDDPGIPEVVLKDVLTPEQIAELKAPKNRGGRPRAAQPRTKLAIRVEPDVLAAWRASGKGWQTRIAGLLKAHKPG